MSVWSVAMTWVMDATPSPTPSITEADLVTPGPWGFAATAFIALATIGLIYDAVRRIRKVRYTDEIDARLEAELAEREAASGTPDA